MNSANQLTQVWQAATLRSRSCEMLANLRENGKAREGFDVQVMPSTCPQASKLRSSFQGSQAGAALKCSLETGIDACRTCTVDV